MAPSCCIELTPGEQAQLLVIARGSIQHGLTAGRPLEIDRTQLSGALLHEQGNFVTLTQRGILRGCIGTLETTQCLAQSIAANAFNAAFHDTRFTPLTAAELDQTQIEISVLSRPEPMDVHTRRELLAALRPGEDGLLLKEHGHHATFLPKVWDQVPDPRQFVQHLMAKAGLPDDYWSESVRCYRYHALSFAEHPTESGVGPAQLFESDR